MLFPNTGFLLFISITIAVNVLINDTPSAPASSAPLAVSVISVTFGLNFTIRGLSKTLRTADVTSFTPSYVVPKAKHPCFTFGQDKFNSTPSISALFNILQSSTYSSKELPIAFTIIAVSYFLRFGNKCSIAYSIPGFCKPIAFIIPLAVSQTLGGLFPGLGFNDVPFVIIPPNLLKSKNSENSSPYPKVPDATVTGFFIFIPANSTLVFIFFLLY